MKNKQRAEEIATQRVQLLAPLLAGNLDPAKARELRAQICQETGISDRTLRRHLARYRQDGFFGLQPKARHSQESGAIPKAVLEQAILLRREVPSRSVSQLIQIMEWEGLVEKGQIKRSTLQEQLTAHGYSTRQMRMYAETGVATRRWQQPHRNRLWQSDLKYGPYLPIGPKGAMERVYLVTFIDDATRLVLHGEFYPVMDQTVVEDCFRQAIQKHGVPEAVYYDNGKQYRTTWMRRTCSKLGIRLLYAKPYSPEGKGKVERFNRVVDTFLQEASLQKPKTLDQLNELFLVWLSECYQHKPHSALGKSPEEAYRSDSKPLRFVEPELLADAFLHCEQRKVDKAGCISFLGRKYEVGLSFLGCKVDVVYDPQDTTELTIEYPGHKSWRVKGLIIGAKVGERPLLPNHLTTKVADYSRLLTAASTKHQERQERVAPAVSYRAVREDSHV